MREYFWFSHFPEVMLMGQSARRREGFCRDRFRIAFNHDHFRIYLGDIDTYFLGNLLSSSAPDFTSQVIRCAHQEAFSAVEDYWQRQVGTSPVEHVLSLNLHRRHLTASQKAFVALAVLPHLEEQARKRQSDAASQMLSKRWNGPDAEPLLEEIIPQAMEREPQARANAGTLVGVNDRYVADAKAIQAERPDLAAKVVSGEMTLPQAKNQQRRSG